jgi:hypothetical protein
MSVGCSAYQIPVLRARFWHWLDSTLALSGLSLPQQAVSRSASDALEVSMTAQRRLREKWKAPVAEPRAGIAAGSRTRRKASSRYSVGKSDGDGCGWLGDLSPSPPTARDLGNSVSDTPTEILDQADHIFKQTTSPRPAGFEPTRLTESESLAPLRFHTVFLPN